MSMSEQLSSTISRIVEELSQEECKRLSYLCGALDTDRRAANVREVLQSRMDQVEVDHVFLMELMLRMRRYDLLKCVLGTSKNEVEELLENGCSLSEYRVLMADLSEDVDSEDLGSLVFLLSGTLPKEKLEKFECFLDVVVELEKLDQISSNRMDVMEKYLRAIHRMDLVKRLNQYQSRVGCAGRASGSMRSRDQRWPSGTEARNALSRNLSESCGTRQVLSRPSVAAAVPQRPSACRPCERQSDVYRMQSSPRGLCVIIDCVGTEGVHLEQVFESLHFSVSLHRLLSVQDMISTLQNVSKQREHYRADAFACCIISRTRSSELLGTDPRGPGLSLDFVRQLFTPDFCPGLAGKPKLFFIQGYEVSAPQRFVVSAPQRFGVYAEGWSYEPGELETDAPMMAPYKPEILPADADVFWSHCWTEEQQLEMVNHHSVYLQSLSNALTEGWRRRIHMVDIHMGVNRSVFDHNHRNPRSSYHISLRHTLRKNIFFS